MSEKEKCFVFYQRWYTQICLLPKEDQLTLFKAICNYAFERKQDELNVYLEALMVNIRMGIDNDKDKQEAFLKLQKEKSIKAVEARKRYRQQLYGSSDNPTQPVGNPRVNTGNPTQPNNKNKNKNKNENENKNKNKNKELKQEQEDNINNQSEIGLSNPRFDENENGSENNNISSSDDGKEDDRGEVMSEDEKKRLEEEKRKKAFARMIVDFFNLKVKENNSALKPVIILTQRRLERITARAKEFSENAEEILKNAFGNATKSPFLNGINQKGWIASFDWILLPNNFVKVLEGNYNNNQLTIQQQDEYYKRRYKGQRERIETTSTKAEDYERTF